MSITLATVVQGRLSRILNSRDLVAEDVGAYHTDAFDVLGEKYSQKKPHRIDDMIEDFSEILAGYCPENDLTCASHAYQTTKEEFEIANTGVSRELKYPADFDPRLQKSIETMILHIETIDELNLDEVLNSLMEIKEELEGMTDIKDDYKHVGLAGVSVAIESTKLWHATKYDPSHPLHEMINYFDEQGNRRLQLELLSNINFNIRSVILVDFRRTIEKAIELMSGLGIDFTNIIVAASGASAATFASSISIREDDDDFEEPPVEEDDVFDDEFDDFLCGLIECDDDEIAT